MKKALLRASQNLFEESSKKLDEADTLMRASEHVGNMAVRGSDEQCARLLETLLVDVPQVVPS